MVSNNIRVINDIQKLSIDDYQCLVRQYIDYVKEKPFVKSIYQIGSVNDPGISDVDLVVVVDNCCNPHAINQLSINQSQGNNALKYIIFHDIYLYDRESFKNFHYSLYCDNLELLYGEPQPVNKIEASQIDIISLQIIFDFISSRLVQFQQFLASGQLSLRGILVRVSSIKHSYMLLNNLGIEDEEIRKFVERAMDIRKKYTSVNEQTIIKLFLESFYYFSRIVSLAANYFSEKFLNFHSVLEASNSLKINPQFILRFVNQAPDVYRSVKNESTIYYPEEVFYHYLAYTEYSNVISQKARYYLSYCGDESYDLDQAYKDVLKERLSAISSHLKFLKENRAYYAMRGFPGFVVNWNDIAP